MKKVKSEVTLTEADNGKSVTVRPGETVVLHLNENATTGFRWEVAESNEQLIALSDAQYISSHSTGLGAGGERVLIFEAKRQGNTRLALKLWRPWEGDKSIRERFEITIQVTE